MTVQQLQDRISANSLAWHQTEDALERSRLHEENVKLYGTLDNLTGTQSEFDSGSGRWSSTAAGAGDYQGVTAPESGDRSALVAQRQQAATQQKLLGLSQAYESSMDELKRQRAAIGGTYQSARNTLAAQNEIEKQNANTYAVYSGLNAGASGQIALSQSVAHQNDLNTLSAQEANAYAENERAMSEMKRDYSFAMAEAEAEGDRALADALYEEQNRYEEAQRQAWQEEQEMGQKIYQLNRENRRYDTQQVQSAQQTAYDREWDEKKWNHQVSQDALEQANTQWEQQRKERNDEWERQMDLAQQAVREKNADTSAANAATSRYSAATARMNTQLKVAQELANMGDFQGFSALGYSQTQIENMEAMWKRYMEER